ncbi:MAG: hypothetical protein A2268_14405 [Candidatus Raymondbacteria bacterium RifOxyA12_full_50_37]|uniref:Heparinase II/III-like C-terminal domain-containing protein n=1 Tax=Candidatus Raymondbacteria bacterium RIFOXYD12_FULL_49_13 TaxID=1817890 RepID=A0A1F7F903_UNCRA|nr:MAG: hypothetical protein A2268_14405 [Candidatus Raymondbacteria bacterium RifOxyA12_full_50_37]OGJ88612.1 MAG: hypothetical protein A2248_20340 [Candidatus Raymondbacteria bacterium RIFOXYA2_FULL_49_16]OGK03149.1 MAG: hypothetical protein A2519_07025 [Candidatus Raymondbacteria bacterium RIFOXYD12_FULL_49_13]OGP41648.1 MAG: hypothetical protein A2324_07425 [Candidatus Raymondbacteria bacterium RIFOXYB2_FULL_49_35]
MPPKKTDRQAQGTEVLPFSLLFDQKSLVTIRRTLKTPWGLKIMEDLRNQCKEILNKGLETKDGAWVQVSHDAMTLAFVGFVDGSEEYLFAAKVRVLAVSRTDPLLWKQMLDTGEGVTGMCLALDWGWKAYSEQEAIAVIEAIIASAIENGDPAAALNNYPDSGQNDGYTQSLAGFLRYDAKSPDLWGLSNARPWHKEIYTTNNWDVVVGSGLMLGWAVVEKAVSTLKLPIGKTRALGFALDQKKIDTWYGIAKQRYLNFTSRCYSARGQYCEGPGYYSFGTQYGLLGLEVARRMKNEDLYSIGLKKSPYWQRELYPWDVAQGAMNLNDSRLDGHPYPHIIARLAAENQSAWMQEFFFKLIEATDRFSPLAIIWADPDLKPGSLQPDLLYVDFGETGDAVWRTGRSVEKDMQCIFRCGKWNGAHTHKDRNSLVLSAFGERLLVDAGVSWPYGTEVCEQYQRATIGHNTVLMGGKGQTGSNDLPTWGRVLRSEWDSLGNAFIVGDAKHCYAKASTALRAVRFDREGFVVVYDYCESPEKEYSVLWHADNRDGKAGISEEADGVVRITRPRAEVVIIPLVAPASIKQGQGYIDHGPKGSGVYVEVKQNNGVFLNVLVPLKPGEKAPYEIKGNGKERVILLTLRGKRHVLSLYEQGAGFLLDKIPFDLTKYY